ncbi:MAG: VCBS repeat-containing protein [Chitinophagia bacterium]
MLAKINRYSWIFFLVVAALSSACKHNSADSGEAVFSLLSSQQTGIDFENIVTDSREMNILNYHNFYNGGGVAIGDLNNDGLPDLVLTANQLSCKVYFNSGGLRFREATKESGFVSKHRWHTGVTLADVNSDGWLDIYLCNAGMLPGDDRSNELFINQKNGTFLEQAHQYGLDDKGASTQATFFDYDHDGDLDCFVLNNSPKSVDNFGYKSDARFVRDAIHGDRLYQNQLGKFVDVSEAAGIYGSEIAFGLGVTVGDVNNDGWEDLYVANDFFEHDYLYINQQNGRFKEVADEAIGHMSNGAMGTDMADVNNDGYLDMFTAEMLPENDYRLKTTIRFDGYDVQHARNRLRLHHQFTANTLQINNQDGTFSELAQLSGMDATGWSWGTLCFDFNNDGWKDVFVCNGIRRDLTDQDFLAYFNSEENLSRVRQGGYDFLDLLNKMPAVPIQNFAFLNNGDGLFSDQSTRLGITQKSFSSGAAYADLDGDGDLDLVINNVNGPVFVYQNKTREQKKGHYVTIRLRGDSINPFGVGARVILFQGTQKQLLEQVPARGFQSCVHTDLLFGFSSNQPVDSIWVTWPGGKAERLIKPHIDTVLTVFQQNATLFRSTQSKPSPLYTEFPNHRIAGNRAHVENDFVDFNVERLLLKLLSTEGPKLAVGDVNGDGLEDFFVGSAKGDTAKLFCQQSNGSFHQVPQKAFIADYYFEDTGATLLDTDGDGDLDLVVVSGGNEVATGSPFLAPRLYLNNGKGIFSAATTGWPSLSIQASCVKSGDMDGDGDLDLFIGGRNVPGSYGNIPASLLLENMGKGIFKDVTPAKAPALLKAGMVTDAAWVDLDGDHSIELVLAGDWMPLKVFSFSSRILQLAYEIPNSSGWWNCLKIADIDGNRTPDIIAGNFGLNSNIKADSAHPARLFTSDFDQNGQSESIPVFYKPDGKSYPYYLKDEIEAQLPFLKKRFLQYQSYAGKSIEEIFNKQELEKASRLSVTETNTTIFYNSGNGKFTARQLPIQAQVAPVYGIVVSDLNGDGTLDIFLAGNFYGLKPQTGRLDASYGVTFLQKNGNWQYLLPKESGLFIRGEVRDILPIGLSGGKRGLLVSRNNAPFILFQPTEQDAHQ